MCNAHNHSPRCTCGWGGEGSTASGNGYAGTSYTNIFINRSRTWTEPEFTKPTRCPECGAAVFFIRHNGGCVWVDELGWPWPKHACFDTPGEPTQTFKNWTAKSSGLTNPQLAIVVRIFDETESGDTSIEINNTNGNRYTMILRWTPPSGTLLGALIIYSTEDNLLLHQQHAEIPFHSLHPKAPGAHGWYECPRCKAWVKDGTGHENYCRKNFVKDKPQQIANAKQHPNKIPGSAPTAQFNPVMGQRKKSKVIYVARPKRPLPPKTLIRPSEPYQLPKKEAQIQTTVDMVARMAWEAVQGVTSAENQLQQAKHKALGLIAGLSPKIRKQVMHKYTSEKWTPLIERKPQGL
jgi:hypothetical protein